MSDEYEKIQHLLSEEKHKQDNRFENQMSPLMEIIYFAPISLVLIGAVTVVFMLSNSELGLYKIVFGATLSVLVPSASWLTWSFYINQTTRLGEAQRRAWTNKSNNKFVKIYSNMSIDNLAMINCIVGIIIIIILILIANI